MARKRPGSKQQRPVHDFEIKTIHEQQDRALEVIERNTVCFLTGPAGTAKTFLATMFAVKSLLAGRTGKIYLTRPCVEAGEKIGFLPGTAQEKSGEFLKPIFNILGDTVGDDARDMVNISTEIIPLAYMRGWTFKDGISIFDEAQNATKAQMKLYLSRLGVGSKLIICGDTDQIDIRDSALAKTAEALSKIASVGWFEFDEDAIVRHPLIGPMMKGMRNV